MRKWNGNQQGFVAGRLTIEKVNEAGDLKIIEKAKLETDGEKLTREGERIPFGGIWKVVLMSGI